MPAWTEAHGSGYGDVVPYRGGGASAAARLGAVAVLVRSVTARSLRSPHTGAMRYAADAPKIPAAAVTTEDADLIARLAAAGPVRVTLTMGARQLPDAPSANVLGELRGRERPDEIVLIGAHLDSWDVGQGAHDDGAGVVHVMQALTTLRALGLTPRRTVRVVLFTNEENGLRGGRGYAAAHAGDRHVAALETDSGGFAPRGFRVDAHGDGALRARLVEAIGLLAPLGATEVTDDEAGADVGPLVDAGVLGLGLAVDGRSYFDIHHTAADTLDKVDPQALADGVAAIAVIAYVLADVDPALVPASAPPPPRHKVTASASRSASTRLGRRSGASGAPSTTIASRRSNALASAATASPRVSGPVSACARARRIMAAAGVDAGAIAIEDRARTTADNARLVRALAPEVRTIWLATQRFHTRRAARLFRAHGFDVRAAHPVAGLEVDDPGRALRWALREYGAWARALVR